MVGAMLHRRGLGHSVANTASCRVADRAGFRLEATLRSALLHSDGWAVRYWEALHPTSAGGAYVNFMMDEGTDRVRASYGRNYDRLARIKASYDPGNFFRTNQNIKPAG